MLTCCCCIFVSLCNIPLSIHNSNLYLESIKPTDVCFTITEHGTGLLTWRKPDALIGNDLEVVSVQRALSSRTEEEDSWNGIHDRGKISRWIRAIKQEGKISRPHCMQLFGNQVIISMCVYNKASGSIGLNVLNIYQYFKKVWSISSCFKKCCCHFSN